MEDSEFYGVQKGFIWSPDHLMHCWPRYKQTDSSFELSPEIIMTNIPNKLYEDCGKKNEPWSVHKLKCWRQATYKGRSQKYTTMFSCE